MNRHTRRIGIYGIILSISAAIHGKPVTIANSQEFTTKVLTSKKPTVVNFSSDKCPICVNIKDAYATTARNDSSVMYVMVDIDKLPALAKQYGISGIPTFVFIKNGEEAGKEIGVQNTDDFAHELHINIDHYLKGKPMPQAAQQETLGTTLSTYYERAKGALRAGYEKFRGLFR